MFFNILDVVVEEDWTNLLFGIGFGDQCRIGGDRGVQVQNGLIERLLAGADGKDDIWCYISWFILMHDSSSVGQVEY